MQDERYDLVVIGGGLVGLATALGAVRMGARCIVLDADDGTFRASRGNFGLVWAQSKGADSREYAQWTREAVLGWPDLRDELQELTGIDTHLRTGFGAHVCLGESEVHARARLVEKVAAHELPGDDIRMIDREELDALLPGLGPDVTGASVSSLDGDCHSLSLYRALAVAVAEHGGRIVSNARVKSITANGAGYMVESEKDRVSAGKVLIAAGLGTNELAGPFGFPALVHPQKGQILVTERTAALLPVPMSNLRQTPEGSILIGDTKEDAGLDDRSTSAAIHTLAARALRILPALQHIRIVRSWGALRVLTRDGRPVYDESPTHPGIFVASTHSGVTLAPVHRGALAQWILHGQKPVEFRAFASSRLHDQTGEV